MLRCMETSNWMNRAKAFHATAGTHRVYYITRMSICPLAFVHTCVFVAQGNIYRRKTWALLKMVA
jgi:hypothetical protein